MRSLSDAERQMDAVWKEAKPSWELSQVKDGFDVLVARVWQFVPDGPEKTIVLRKLQAAAAIAHVAFVLEPTDDA